MRVRISGGRRRKGKGGVAAAGVASEDPAVIACVGSSGCFEEAFVPFLFFLLSSGMGKAFTRPARHDGGIRWNP